MERQGESCPDLTWSYIHFSPTDECFTALTCQYVLGTSPYQFMKTFIFLFHSCIVLQGVATL